MTRQKSEGHLDMRKGELEEMRASILKDLQDIAAIKPEDAQNNRIMAATAEIDAIVTASERATNNFYGAAKGPQQIGAKLREPGCGTAVRLRLPQAEAPISRDSDQPVESVSAEVARSPFASAKGSAKPSKTRQNKRYAFRMSPLVRDDRLVLQALRIIHRDKLPVRPVPVKLTVHFEPALISELL